MENVPKRKIVKIIILLAAVVITLILSSSSGSRQTEMISRPLDAAKGTAQRLPRATLPPQNTPPPTASIDLLPIPGPNTTLRMCTDLGSWPESNPYFSQVYSPHIGYVPPDTIRKVLLALLPLTFPNATPKLIVFALDGTLLNLMRWGRVHNDNDIDLGFYFVGESHVMQQYYYMLDALQQAGVIYPQSERDKKKLHSSNLPVRVGKCKHRGQIMQCRHKDTGVHVDLFGPDTLFSVHSRLTEDQLLPVRPCRSFDFEFPCPNKPMEVLTSVSLDFGQLAGKDAPVEGVAPLRAKANEFQGCPLFPRNASEQSAKHLSSIFASTESLNACGYPNLLQGTLLPLPSANSLTFTKDAHCLKLMAKAGIM
eukprot:GILI01038318.1.p1 GENE.GILI01038318.1~~GILI01038318.1.p1  ORF type:complete len:367 (+),score=-2.20 GILI01038318.1:54-1154(+)